MATTFLNNLDYDLDYLSTFLKDARRCSPLLKPKDSKLNKIIESHFNTSILPLLPSSSRDIDKKRHTYKVLFSNLFVSVVTNKPIAISLYKDTYLTDIFKVNNITYTNIKVLLDILIKEKYIGIFAGYRFETGSTVIGRTSRMICLQRFIDLTANITRNLRAAVSIEALSDNSRILLRDSNKKELQMPYFPIKTLSLLKKHDKLLNQSKITFCFEDNMKNKDLLNLAIESQIEGAFDLYRQDVSSLSTVNSLDFVYTCGVYQYRTAINEPLNLTVLFNQNTLNLTRVYSTNMKQGGRFYNYYFQSLPKEIRKNIKINDQPTIELDYSNLHYRMLYHMEGIEYDKDCYLELCDTPQDRKLSKLISIIAINSKTERGAIQGVINTYHKANLVIPERAVIKSFIDKIKTTHAPIAKYLFSGIGLTLQNKDSQITERILMKMTKLGVVCLPVHDSYIVQEFYDQILYKTMMESYKEVMGFNPVIK